MRGWDDDSKEHKFASLGTVTPRFLLARSPVSEPRSVRQDPGPPPGQETRGWEDRRSRGLSRQRRSGGALRQRTDATQRRAIRPARPFLRLFHIRQSFLLQRLVPSGWRSRRSSVPRPRAGGRNRRHGGSAGRAPRSRKRQERSAKADQRAGATGPGFGHYARTRQRKRPDQHPVRSDYRRRCLPSPPHRGYAARRHHQGGRTPAALHHCRKQVPFKTLSHGPGGDSCPRLSGRGQLGSSGGVSCAETVTPCPIDFHNGPRAPPHFSKPRSVAPLDSRGGCRPMVCGSSRPQHNVVDQPRLAHEGRHGNKRGAGDVLNRIERLGIDYFKVVQQHRWHFREDRLSGLDQPAGFVFSLIEPLLNLNERAVEYWRGLALLRIEIGIAGAHRQPVRLTQGGTGHDLHRNIQVANHAPDNHSLGRVFLSEEREVGLYDVEELRNHSGYAAKMFRTRAPAKFTAELLDRNVGDRARRIHFFQAWRKQKIHALFFQQFAIAIKITRIFR